MISNCSKDIYEPHIDGFEVTGDLQIKRNKTKEISNKQFSSTVKQDPWKDEQLMMTRSIRSYKSLHGTFASISPEMMRSKSVRNLTSNEKTYDLNDSPMPIEIKVNKDETICSNRANAEK